MKPVYKCDYCNFMDTREKVRDHEIECMNNYDRKSCYTCQHKGDLKMNNFHIKYQCNKGIDIPEDKVYEFCNLYERKEKAESPYSDLVGTMFGGFKGF